MDAYERVLGDAMQGDATLFAREDYVEEAWCIVDQALAADAPVHDYAPGTWARQKLKTLNPTAAGMAPVCTIPGRVSESPKRNPNGCHSRRFAPCCGARTA